MPRGEFFLSGMSESTARRRYEGAGLKSIGPCGDGAYLGRKPSFTREQLVKVRDSVSSFMAAVAEGWMPGLIRLDDDLLRESRLSRQCRHKNLRPRA